jgi:hypothetical protein
LDKRITEEELRRRSSEVEDEVSSLEEIMAQKKLVKEGKIEVVENPRFMTEARQKELERRQRQESSTPVVKEEKRKFSLFHHHHHHRSESRPDAAIQKFMVEQNQEAGGASAVPPPSDAISDSPSKPTSSPPKLSSSPSKGWFIGGLKGFFGPRQSTPQSSPTRQRSTKSTKTITAVINDRNLPLTTRTL